MRTIGRALRRSTLSRAPAEDLSLYCIKLTRNDLIALYEIAGGKPSRVLRKEEE